jgi:type IV secretory pathway VirB4 component
VGACPAALEPSRSQVRIGDGYAASFAVTGYPAEVGPAWLEALLAVPGRVSLAVHIDPIPAPSAAPLLRRQRARLESTRRLDAEAGRLGDPAVEAAATDAAGLAERVARGAAKLFRVGVYLTVHARTVPELDQACAQVRSAAASVLLDVQPATWRHHDGWATTLPLGTDRLGRRRVLDTDALAAAFPFASADLPAPVPGVLPATTAVLYGVTPTASGVLLWDRWSCDNFNSVVLARSGAGKSYLVKLDVLRSLYQGVAVSVVDPEDEYTALADHVGGTVIRLGVPGVRINPFDLPENDRRPDALTRRALFVHTAIAVMLGHAPSPAERAVLDRAITVTYRTAGITFDPATWTRPAPLLTDLAAVLARDSDTVGPVLAARLHPWTSGSFAALFDGPSTTRQTPPLTVWSLRHLSDEIRAVGILLALDAIWRDTDAAGPGQALQRRMVIVDEAWTLLRDGEGAAFLYRMAKAARKRATGLTVVTQDAADVLGTDLGQAVVANAATQILLRQAPQAIDAVTAAFGLTPAEARLLVNAPRGDGLLLSGTTRIPFHAVASPTEHAVASGQPPTSSSDGGRR